MLLKHGDGHFNLSCPTCGVSLSAHQPDTCLDRWVDQILLLTDTEFDGVQMWSRVHAATPTLAKLVAKAMPFWNNKAVTRTAAFAVYLHSDETWTAYFQAVAGFPIDQTRSSKMALAVVKAAIIAVTLLRHSEVRGAIERAAQEAARREGEEDET